jgi:hypothetical protein
VNSVHGENMKRTTRTPRQTIEKAIAKLINPTWKDLLKETKLSKGALSKYLNQLIRYDRVIIFVDTSTIPKTNRYLAGPIPKLEDYKTQIEERSKKPKNSSFDLEKYNMKLIGFCEQSGYQISRIVDRNRAKKLLSEYLQFNLDALGIWILHSIIYSNSFSKGIMDKIKSKDIQKQQEVLIKRLKTYFIKDFITPWIESLASSAIYNKDIEKIYENALIERGKATNLSFLNNMIELTHQ